MHISYAIIQIMLSSIEILILSAVQGISEFLPVSSVAHLELISQIYNFKKRKYINLYMFTPGFTSSNNNLF